MRLQKFFEELKRRNVIKTAGAYAVAAWLLIQVAVTIKTPLHLPDWIDTAVIIAAFVGFPIVLIISWVFELTPEGFQKTDEIAEKDTEYFSKSTGKKLNKVIIGSLSLVIVLLVTERVFLAGDFFEEIQPSIAILPFTNISSDEENEYFSDGLSIELMDRIGRIEAINVIGKTSAFRFKGASVDYQEINESLGVDHILEGSVRKEGDLLRISASLIKVPEGTQLWTEVYDRKLESVFTVQEDVAREVAGQLQVQLSIQDELEIAKNITVDPQAYESYLKARDFRGSISLIDSAIVYHKEAIAIDPQFAAAYAALAYCYGLKSEYQSIPLEDIEPLMRENIEKSLLIDPNLPYAYEALGVLYRRKFYEWNPEYEDGRDTSYAEKSLEYFQKVKEFSPHEASSYMYLGLAYETLEKRDSAFFYTKKAYEMDPADINYAGNYAYQLSLSGEIDAAIALYNELINLYPLQKDGRNLQLVYQKGTAQNIAKNQLDEAFITYYDAYSVIGPNPFLMNALLNQSIILDLEGLALELLEEFKKVDPDGYWNKLGFFYARSGQNDKARDILGTHRKERLGFDYERRLMIEEVNHLFNQEKVKEAEMVLRDDLSKGENRFMSPFRREKMLALFLKELGEHDKADSILSVVVESQPELSDLEKRATLLDIEASKEIDNDEYFSGERGVKYNFLLIPSLQRIYFDEHGAYEEIRKDRNQMRTNVINHLKEIGVWKPEWKVNDEVLFSKRPSHLKKLENQDLRAQ